MNTGYAIEVNHVSKSFKVYLDKGNQLKEKILFHKRNQHENRTVLKDISFKVKKGEGIGLVGHNGCGKSTMLKLLTKIMYPDSGDITMHGRVAALIELGAGFHPDMSGRENIYTNAAIFGLTRKEIDEKLDDIIAFSELEDYIDNPVRTYSSGMYMRLAFSVAINIDADILLIDEILAVGDAAFQAKCFNRLKEIKASGTTIVIVSHALAQIEEICERSIWIHEGLIKEQGEPKEVHKKYLEYVNQYRQDMAAKELQRQKAKEQQELKKQQEEEKKKAEEEIKKIEEARKGDNTIVIQEVTMYNGKGIAQTIIETGDSVKVEIKYRVNKPEKDVAFALGILRIDGTLCYSTNTITEAVNLPDICHDGRILFDIKELELLPGGYSIDVALMHKNQEVICYKSQAYKFEMISNIGDAGVARIEHTWQLEEGVNNND